MLAFTCKTWAQEDGVQRKAPFYASLGYKQTYGEVLPSSGTNFALGVNVAGLFKQNYFLGLFVEARGMKVLCTNRKYGRIRNAVEDNLIYAQPTYADSLRVRMLYSAFNSHPRFHFGGGYLLNFGIAFSPYPDDYGGLMLKIKRGREELGIDGAYGYDVLEYETEDYIFLTTPIDFGLELISKPLLFAANRCRSYWLTEFCKGLQAGVFYNRINMRRSRLNTAPLTNFIGPAFFDAYGLSNHFGFTISFGYY